MTDYKKEYFNLIKKTGFKSLPKKKFLNENRELAIYVWNDKYNLNIVKEYEKYNVKEVFDKYKDDIDFWSTVIKIKDNFELLFNPQFKRDFNFIYDSLVNDKELIKDIYINTKKHLGVNRLFSLLSQEDKNIAFQERDKKGNFSFEYIINNIYIFDDEFISNYMLVNPNIYSHLSEEKKNDLNFINTYISNFENFINLSEENKLKVFDEEKILKFFEDEKNDYKKYKMYRALTEEQRNDMKFIRGYVANNNWNAFLTLTKENQNIIFDEMNNSQEAVQVNLYNFKYFQKDHLKKFIAVHPDFLPLLNNDLKKVLNQVDVFTSSNKSKYKP